MAFCCSLVCLSPCDAQSNVTMSQHFRHIGALATGVSHAHIYGKVDFAKLRESYAGIIEHIRDREAASNSTEERAFIGTLSPQLRVASEALDDIEELFFHQESPGRQKRQFLAAAVAGFSVVNVGVTLYNSVQIQKMAVALSQQQDETEEGFRHVAQALREEDQAVHQLTLNVRDLESQCRGVLKMLEEQSSHVSYLANAVSTLTLVNNLNMELLTWGRGLDFLTNGRLHPALVDPERLRIGYERVLVKAGALGLRPLHREASHLYKSPVSYLATSDRQIMMVVHLALVKKAPLKLYKHLPIPTRTGNIFVTLESESAKTILATDEFGARGLELSQLDLLRCRSEDRIAGKLFLCPDTNLVAKEVRRTCLGALYFGREQDAARKCLHFAHRLQADEELAQQVAPDELVLSLADNTAVEEACPGEPAAVTVVPPGVTSLRVRPGCKLTTRSYTFTSPAVLDMPSEFVKTTVTIPRPPMLSPERASHTEQSLAALELDKAKGPAERTHLAELEAWMAKAKSSSRYRNLRALAETASLCALGLLIFYTASRHRHYQPPQEPV